MAHPLKIYRVTNDLTLKDFAKLIGSTAANVSRWENLKQRPSPATVVKIEAATGGAVTENHLTPEPSQ